MPTLMSVAKVAAPTGRLIRFTTHGLGEDPAGLIVTTPTGDLRWVDSAYRRETAPFVHMLRVRSASGERQTDVAAASVRVVGPSGAFPRHRLTGVQA